MIRDLSESLRAVLSAPILATDYPELAVADIVFERPAQSYNPTQTTVDLFLYDVRENLELRNNEPVVERHNHEATIRKPPRRVDCAYLVTTWPVGGADLALQEHRLLAQVLQVLGRYPTIPAPFLQGSLVGQEPPLPMIAPEVDGMKSTAEFWTAMGNQLRAAFTVTATISVPSFPDATGPLVTTLRSDFDAGAETLDETWFQIGGRVLDAGGSGVAGAVVDVVDAGRRARTDAGGRYAIARVPRGTRSFRVVAAGFQPFTQAVAVPGRPEDYEFTLTPL